MFQQKSTTQMSTENVSRTNCYDTANTGWVKKKGETILKVNKIFLYQGSDVGLGKEQGAVLLQWGLIGSYD